MTPPSPDPDPAVARIEAAPAPAPTPTPTPTTAAEAVRQASIQIEAAMAERNQARVAAGKQPLPNSTPADAHPCARCIKAMVLNIKTSCVKETAGARCSRCAGLHKECLPVVPAQLYPRVEQLQRFRARYACAGGDAKRAMKPRIIVAAHRLTQRIEGGRWMGKETGAASTVVPEAISNPRIARARFERSLVEALRGVADATARAANVKGPKWSPLPHGDVPPWRPADEAYDRIEYETDPVEEDDDD
ncbi:MAG: hypothetical protein M1826_002413 [Phylliscum demangeonii]|nr:MAG: hypothetical protein M1826_002413 [Phylliscum demangeonii]